MHWLHRSGQPVRRLGVLAGTFNPLTCAHLALARAAFPEVEEVLLALPETLPHKDFAGASRQQREQMLELVATAEPGLSAATTTGGILAEMAEEIQAACGPATELYFVCGRDAAERIVSWRYEDPEVLPRFLTSCRMLVAPRQGPYEPPPQYAGAILPLPLAEEFQVMSATDIRRRIRSGEPWEDLVPAPIVSMVRAIYS